MKFLNKKAVHSVFKGRKQISKEALEMIDRKVGMYLEKLATEPREKRLTEFIVQYFKIS